MPVKARRTSNSTSGDLAEVLYNDGEGRVDDESSTLREMTIDEAHEVLRNSGFSNLTGDVADAERPHTAHTYEFNLVLPERDFSSLLERLSAMERAFTNGDKRQESSRNPTILSFTRQELERYTAHRLKGLAPKSQDWIRRADAAIWAVTGGAVTEENMTALRDYALSTYTSVESHKKILSFATAFLKFLSKTTFNQQFQAYTVYLELPKAVKTRKAVTGRIVTINDVQNVLAYVKRAYEEGRINERRYRQYTAMVIFGAFTGQRFESTIARLTVGQFREALEMEKPVLRVEPHQDKIRFGHEVPLHPRVVDAVLPLLNDRDDGEEVFEYISFLQWVKRTKISMSRFKGHFVLGDLRKFA